MYDKTKAREYLRRFSDMRPKKLLRCMDDTERGLLVILRMLDGATGEVVAGDIADELCMSTPRVAAALNALERKGYAVRERAETDRRKTVVCITESGRQAVYSGEEIILELMEHVLKSVGESDLDEFIRISGKIKAAIEEHTCRADNIRQD